MAFKSPRRPDLASELAHAYKTAPSRKVNPVRALTVGYLTFVERYKPVKGGPKQAVGYTSSESEGWADFYYYNVEEAMASGTFSAIYWYLFQ